MSRRELSITVADQTGAEAAVALEHAETITTKDLALMLSLFDGSETIKGISLREEA